uniref:hypothetical protein n=1 Tax=Acinetobacter tandoii TaxID=202954 RepID=UPI003F49413A
MITGSVLEFIEDHKCSSLLGLILTLGFGFSIAPAFTAIAFVFACCFIPFLFAADALYTAFSA